MAQVDIDCRGLRCPEPVLKTKGALAEGRGVFTVLVDNAAAKDNVSRFARTAGCKVAVEDADAGFLISVTPSPDSESASEREQVSSPRGSSVTVIFISSDVMGVGDRKLGETLMKSFLFTATEAEEVPSRLIFMNSGVRLVTENEDTVSHIKLLEERGVEVLACGTCLDFYGLKDKLKVGNVSNMYDIHSALVSAERLVSL